MRRFFKIHPDARFQSRTPLLDMHDKSSEPKRWTPLLDLVTLMAIASAIFAALRLLNVV